MKRFFLAAALVSCLAIPACQCSDKPEIGPVENAAASLPDSPAQSLAG